MRRVRLADYLMPLGYGAFDSQSLDHRWSQVT